MTDLSPKNLQKNCPHCDPKSFALKHPLITTDNFTVVCDVHPLIEGHILIIPKAHLSCVGEFSKPLFKEFLSLYQKTSKFLKNTYGSTSSFEHGKIGQTVFHSHVHLMPFKGETLDIIPEGQKHLTKITDLSALAKTYQQHQKYLFFSIDQQNWLVDLKLGEPRFFRDRFAKALKVPKRGNWKLMHQDQNLMKKAQQDIINLTNKWEKHA